MKKFTLTSLLLLAIVVALFSQVPQAFKYQAVARDNAGNILANKNISLRVSILLGSAEGIPVYSETHFARTNFTGLVNLVVGFGNDPTANFSEINWSEGNYFIRIEMDENGGNDFKSMGVSQVLSVPYALQAGTAFGLAGPWDETLGGGVPSNVWSLFGNSNSNPMVDKLGTTDNADLVMVTNNIERLRIKSGGDIDIARSLWIGENLTVQQNVYLNSLSGATINYGPFTVANLSPSLLSGTLTVDQATDLNSSLNVDGVTDLNSAFHVNNASPSILTGTLLVNGDATFNMHVLLDNDTLSSTSPQTGALVVNGGVGIGENLNVGGAAEFDGEVTMNKPLLLTDTTASVDSESGALVVAGGVGIGRQLNVDGASVLNNTLAANGQVTITANPGDGTESDFANYPLRVQGSTQGIAVKVNGSRTGANNFITFWDSENIQGRIEGQTIDELENDPDYKEDIRNKNYGVATASIGVAIATWELAQAFVGVAAASSSSTACVGFGACITSPIPSLIISAGANVVLKIANLTSNALNLADAVINKDYYIESKHANIGVTYSSGSGDYAEWLPKLDPAEKFLPGQVIAVKNGFITKNTDGASQLMVVSHKPIVLGNVPPDGREDAFEKVAFMGQVPVRVMGPAQPGDYILPSGLHDGSGRPVNPADMKAGDFRSVVGVAWSSSGDEPFGFINVAVGLGVNSAADVMQNQAEEIGKLKDQVDRLYSALAVLVPGFAEATGSTAPAQPGLVPMAQQGTAAFEMRRPTNDEIVYMEITRGQVDAMIELARYEFVSGNGDLSTHPFWSKMQSDGAFKEQFIAEFMTKTNEAIQKHREMNSRITD